MGRTLIENKKAYFRQTFTYDSEFEQDLQRFLINIQKDNNFLDKDNDNLNRSRFSRAIRFLIKQYNSWFEKKHGESKTIN